jgi:hypothetical protein
MIREEHRLRMSENRALRRIFGLKRMKVNKRLKKTAYDELHNLNFSTNNVWAIKSKRMRWIGHPERMRVMINAYEILIGITEGKEPLEIPGHAQEDNIRMHFKETGREDVDTAHLALGKDHWWALVNTVINRRAL